MDWTETETACACADTEAQLKLLFLKVVLLKKSVRLSNVLFSFIDKVQVHHKLSCQR